MRPTRTGVRDARKNSALRLPLVSFLLDSDLQSRKTVELPHGTVILAQ